MATTTKKTAADPAPAEDLKTEAEKKGPDPVGKAKEPEKVKTIEDEGVGVRDPYPTGSPPDPEEAFKAAHGYARAKE